jgi:KDO2-lipid IV(A) lauroyltransferase
LVRGTFHFFFALFRVLPLGIINFLSNGLIPLAYLILKRMRKHAMESLSIAFGNEKTQEELKQIRKQSMYNLGKGFVELAYGLAHHDYFEKNMNLPEVSKKYLEDAIKEGKGVVAVTAHFGAFSIMFARLALLGYPINTILRPSRDPKLEKPLEDIRISVRLKSIYSSPKITCVTQTLRALRANEVVIIPIDQNHGSKAGTFVQFFGRPAGTASGPVIFAMRTGSPILPIFTVRTGKNSHTILSEPHFYLEKKATDEETIQYNTQKITTIIERYIRQYPHEWGWMHRRWKSQPKQQEPSAVQNISEGDVL